MWASTSLTKWVLLLCQFFLLQKRIYCFPEIQEHTESLHINSTQFSSQYSQNFIFGKSGFIAGDGFCQCGRPVHRIPKVSANLRKQHHTYAVIQKNDIPWTATFVHEAHNEIFCTGVLINNLYILTAAHCVKKISPTEMKVVLNEGDFLPSIEKLDSLPKYDVSSIIVHPEYISSNTDHHGTNDIALVRLSESLDFFGQFWNLYPICVPFKNGDYKKFNGTITKWEDQDPLSGKGVGGNSQVKLNLPLLSNQQCNTETTHKGMISEDMLCAGFLNGLQTCRGDSGGAITIKKGDRHHLVGIALFEDGCSIAYSPSIYTLVGKYVDWILRNTADAEWCSE